LALFYKILKPEGKLHIDVPDFEETAKQLLAQKTEKEKEGDQNRKRLDVPQ